jgi:hypothetical protein
MEGCSFRITRLLTFLFAALILQAASGASAEQETKSQSGGSAPAQSGPPLVCVYLKNFGAVRDFTASQLQEHLVKFLSDPIFGVKPVTLKKGDSRYCDYLLTIDNGITSWATDFGHKIEAVTPTGRKIIDEGMTSVPDGSRRDLVFPAVEREASTAVGALKLGRRRVDRP